MRQRKTKRRGKITKNKPAKKPPKLQRNKSVLAPRKTFKKLSQSDRFFEEVRNYVREYKTEFGMCTDCKNPFPPYVLEFDHLDSTTKRFNVGDAASVPSMEALQEEIDKCELVCSNCHKKREHARREETARRLQAAKR